MNLRHRLIGGLVGLATAGAILIAPASVAAATPAPTAATTAAVCTDGHWPASVQGRPLVFRAGARAGDYIWHDATGWHFRVTHPGTTRAVFTGRIVANAPISFHAVRLEAGDTLTLSADKKTLTYRLVNYGKVDGIDFTTACASRVAFAGRLNGLALPTWRIWLGTAGRHPLENPFVVTRIG